MLEAERAEARAKLMETLEHRAKRSRHVITSDQALSEHSRTSVGIEGLIHVSEMGWDRVQDPYQRSSNPVMHVMPCRS